jgi:hypothetical protein
VDLVDEENRVLLLRQSVEHLLHALLEVAAVARSRDERAEIEREDARPLQHVRNLALLDAQRESFCKRGLPHSGFSDQQRIVLAAPAQHLDHPLDLEGAADERIDLPCRRPRDEIRRVRLQRVRSGRRLVSPRRCGRGFGLGTVRKDTQQEQPLHPLGTQKVRRMTILLLEEEDEQAAALDVLGARRHGVHHRLLNDAIESKRGFRFDDGRAHDRSERLGENVGELTPQHLDVGAAGCQDAPRLRLVRDREEQMFEPDFFVAPIGRQAEGALDCLQCLRRKRHGCLTHVQVLRRAPS